MDTSTNPSNPETWPPSWEQHSTLSPLLRPHSTATVINNGTRPRPELWDICTGCILWLPPKSDISEIPNPQLSSLAPPFFNHPILVLDIHITNPQAATVRFVKMTSLRQRSLQQSTHPTHWDEYLPIYPASPHPNSKILLHLENETPKRCMVDNSYVSIGEGMFSIDYRALRCYAVGQKADGYRYRLTEESFDRVTRALEYSSSAWIKTRELWEEFIERHVLTAG